MNRKAAKVVLADDHVLYRDCLRGLFERWDDFEIVGEGSTGVEALALCRSLNPDLVLMDISMPEMSGIDALKVIADEMPMLAVVMLSSSIDEDSLVAAFLHGARGYLLKNIHGYQLRSRLREVLAGDIVLSGEAVQICLHAIRRRQGIWRANAESTGLLSALTEIERQILYYVALGESNREIGARLYIGESTVKKRLSLILAKLGLENRVQAAVFALNAGLVK